MDGIGFEALVAVIEKYEAGNNHDSRHFNPDCQTCLILRDLRAIKAPGRENAMGRWTPPTDADVEQFLDACDKIEEAFGKPPLNAEQRANAAKMLRTPPDPAEEPTPEQERMAAAWVAMRKSGERGGTA